MRTLNQMVATYRRKLAAFWDGSPNPPDVEAMTVEYRSKVTELRDKQMLTKDILNEAGVPGAKQAHFQVLCNRFWSLQSEKDYGGDTAIAEFATAISLFTVKFAWEETDVDIAILIAFQVFGVTIPSP